ncbi:glycerate kinase family protein [Vampirovibrio chlorellavorus]|uniref:glycerate kinase family protein n=1 Tax=Vampirovibrio chlorellavorus TaxID=758823 RepID=UPI0026F1CEBD|nr:glycerate kinase [Vampirovibrio chlorellavorus]
MNARSPRILIAPACYKGTLSAGEAAEIMQSALREALGDTVDLQVCPIADGGDDTLQVLSQSWAQARLNSLRVTGPIATMPVQAHYLWEPAAKTVIIESAQAHGLKLLGAERHPVAATSYGVGELIRESVRQHQPDTVVVSVGGSASTDGGLGALQALGWRFWDDQNYEIQAPLSGGDLGRIHRLERSPLTAGLTAGHSPLPALRIATDVQNPLLGPQGAAAVFGPQKGASAQQCQQLEQGLAHVSALLKRSFKVDSAALAGAGAAGGLAFGLLHCSENAQLISGSHWIAQALGLHEKVAAADIILTGEGRFDATSLGGKAVGHLLALAGDKPVFLLPGQCQSGLPLPNSSYCQPLAQDEASVQAAMAKPKEALREAVLRVAARQVLPLLKNHLPAS